ncbi:hypothetical protein HMI56_002916 [Coelomomyces lativittatus]|nr:hypothetical protein HMI56_002916 [Coelomomyces lativittatus]
MQRENEFSFLFFFFLNKRIRIEIIFIHGQLDAMNEWVHVHLNEKEEIEENEEDDIRTTTKRFDNKGRNLEEKEALINTFHEKKKVTPTPSTLNDLSTQFDGSVHLTSLNHSNSLHLLSSSSSYPSWVLPGTLDHPFLATTPSSKLETSLLNSTLLEDLSEEIQDTVDEEDNGVDGVLFHPLLHVLCTLFQTLLATWVHAWLPSTSTSTSTSALFPEQDPEDEANLEREGLSSMHPSLSRSCLSKDVVASHTEDEVDPFSMDFLSNPPMSLHPLVHGSSSRLPHSHVPINIIPPPSFRSSPRLQVRPASSRHQKREGEAEGTDEGSLVTSVWAWCHVWVPVLSLVVMYMGVSKLVTWVIEDIQTAWEFTRKIWKLIPVLWHSLPNLSLMSIGSS